MICAHGDSNVRQFHRDLDLSSLLTMLKLLIPSPVERDPLVHFPVSGAPAPEEVA